MISLYNQLIIFAFLQCLFLLLTITFIGKFRPRTNGYRILLLAALFMGLGGKMLFMLEVFGKMSKLIMMFELGTMLFGCTAYLFIRSALFQTKFDKRDLYHYIPAVGYLVMLFSYFYIPSTEVAQSRVASGEILQMVYLFHAVALIVNLTYWVKGLQVYLSYHKTLDEEVSFNVQTRFFYTFLVILGICLVLWIVAYFMSITQSNPFEVQFRLSIWLAIAFLVLFLTIYRFVYPEVYLSLPKLSGKKHVQSKLTSIELLGVSNLEMARLLNEKIRMDIFEFVNYYRIKEFIALAESEKERQLTFFGLAHEAGFNSKTTYNKSFKKLMGISPSQYFYNQKT